MRKKMKNASSGNRTRLLLTVTVAVASPETRAAGECPLHLDIDASPIGKRT